MADSTTSLAKAVRLLCVLCLVMIGFAHKPVEAASAGNIPVYVLPDGSIASICIPGDHDQSPAKAASHGCDACRLSSTALLPTPQDHCGQPLAYAQIVKVQERQYRLARQIYPPSSGPRAPPHAVMMS
ncbi:hypothetical protein [Rhizobium sp. LjRoot254]|uniref:hypothetical protein n=1 Tax=Rhizobium sp. LjRoot254 TaxID=3342297 RepID=UPI003ECDFE64